MGLRDLFARWLLKGVSENVPPPPTGETGVPGTPIYTGMIESDLSGDLKDPYQRLKIYDDLRNDPVIQSVINEVTVSIQAATWTVNPFVEGEALEDIQEADVEVARQVEEWLMEMRDTQFKSFLYEAVLGTFYGCALFVKVWEFMEGKYVLTRLSPRSLKTIDRWEVDEHGLFAGVYQQAFGDQSFQGIIPADQMLRITYRQEGSNFWGDGVFNKMYTPWKRMTSLMDAYEIAMQRVGSGIIHATYDGGTKNNVPQKAQQDLATKAQQLVDGTSHVVVTSDAYEFNILPVHEQRTVLDHIQFLSRQIASTMGAEFLTTGLDGTGSYALVQIQFEKFQRTLEEVAGVIKESVQEQVIKQMVDLNFPAGTGYPVLEFGLPEPSIQIMADTLKTLSDAGLLADSEALKKHITERLGLPYEEADESDAPEPPQPPPFPPQQDEAEIEASADGDGRMVAQVNRRWDPTIDGSGTWRAPTQRERKAGLIQFNRTWDDFVAELMRRLETGSDAAVDGLIDKLRRAFLNNDLRGVRDADFTNVSLENLERAIWDHIQSVLNQTADYFADRLDIGRTEFSASDLAVARALADLQLRRWTDNVKQRVRRRVATSTELIQQVATKQSTTQTVESFLERARADYDGYKTSYLNVEAKAYVNDAVHRANMKMIDHDDVGKVLRSALLDRNTCPNCEALDGRIYNKADAPQMAPPRHCLGGSLCRCFYIGILTTETPQPVAETPAQAPSLQPTAFRSQRPRLDNAFGNVVELNSEGGNGRFTDI